MSSSTVEVEHPLARYVTVDDRSLAVDLSDGRRLAVPLEWYPRLSAGSPAERNNWRLIGRGQGIHWPDLDEDVSTEGLVMGRRSAESKESLRSWKRRHAQGEKEAVPTYPLPGSDK